MESIAGFLLDMDGVLYRGDAVIPGAADFLSSISHLPHRFITNNSSVTAEQVFAKLQRLDLPVSDPAQILTSAQATARLLARERPGFAYFAVGGTGLQQALAAVGEAKSEAVDYVVVGEGPGLDYDSLTLGINLIAQGARLIGTNPDTRVDTTVNGRRQIVPGGGSLLAPFAVASGRKARIIGKPMPALYEMALADMDCAAAHCVMVGDRPDTDIAGAAALGMGTLLVRTGRFGPGEPYPADLPRPDWDVDSLAEFRLNKRR